MVGYSALYNPVSVKRLPLRTLDPKARCVCGIDIYNLLLERGKAILLTSKIAHQNLVEIIEIAARRGRSLPPCFNARILRLHLLLDTRNRIGSTRNCAHEIYLVEIFIAKCVHGHNPKRSAVHKIAPVPGAITPLPETNLNGALFLRIENLWAFKISKDCLPRAGVALRIHHSIERPLHVTRGNRHSVRPYCALIDDKRKLAPILGNAPLGRKRWRHLKRIGICGDKLIVHEREHHDRVRVVVYVSIVALRRLRAEEPYNAALLCVWRSYAIWLLHPIC